MPQGPDCRTCSNCFHVHAVFVCIQQGRILQGSHPWKSPPLLTIYHASEKILTQKKRLTNNEMDATCKVHQHLNQLH